MNLSLIMRLSNMISPKNYSLATCTLTLQVSIYKQIYLKKSVSLPLKACCRSVSLLDIQICSIRDTDLQQPL